MRSDAKSKDEVLESGSAKWALQRGLRALDEQDWRSAVRWLERAHRLSPEDVPCAFSLASALVGLDDVRARSILETLIGRYPEFWAAQVAMAALEDRAGASAAAAMWLGRVLAASTVRPDDGFCRLASRVASQGKYAGWMATIGADAAMVVSIGNIRPRFALDGVPLWPNTVLNKRATTILSLPANWKNARILSGQLASKHLLGSPLTVSRRGAVQGFVSIDERGNLSGWAWLPSSPDENVKLVVAAGLRKEIVAEVEADDTSFVLSQGNGAIQPKGFRCASNSLPFGTMVHVIGPDGNDLSGSPLQLGLEAKANYDAAKITANLLTASAKRSVRRSPLSHESWRPMIAASLSRRTSKNWGLKETPTRVSISVIIPVFRGAEDFRQCLASVRRSVSTHVNLIIVDDGSQDDELLNEVHIAQQSGAIIVRHNKNKGFPSAVNTGMQKVSSLSSGLSDIVLLNPDTILPSGWLEQMAIAAYSAANIGSVTPMCNDGTITSYPTDKPVELLPDQEETDRLGELFQIANRNLVIEIPTAVGFCMFIRHDCLQETGLFREDAFAQGYGEENDWSMRARHLGWIHVAAAGTFVSHAGGRSFGSLKSEFQISNLNRLEELHPGYSALIAEFIKADPLSRARRAIDSHRWRSDVVRQGSVVLVTHSMGGGVERHVTERARVIRRQLGLRTIVLRPAKDRLCMISEGDVAAYRNLILEVETSLDELVAFLKPDRPKWVEIHHMVGHAPQLASLAAALNVPYDLIVHDFAPVCPRIAFSNGTGTHCGEPLDVRDCEDCVADNGSRLEEQIPVADLRARSQRLFQDARTVRVPTQDTLKRLQRYISTGNATVREWQDDLVTSQKVQPPLVHRRLKPTRICVLGAIGDEKGYNVLLACARDAFRRELQLVYVLAGHTHDDGRLIDTGHVEITGKYKEDEALQLISEQECDAGFLPTIIPETWSYSLSSLWQAGLWTFAFDLGAQAERIRRTGKGTLFPLGLPAPMINDNLVRFATGAR